MPETKHKEIGDKLQKFGKYQTIQFVLICVSLSTFSMSVVNYVFVAEDVKYRCRIPECEKENFSIEKPLWWPKIETVNGCLGPVLNKTSYEENNNTCLKTSFQSDWEKCNDWVYENYDALASEFNFGCETWKSSFVGFIHCVAMILSSLIAGWIADKYGRKFCFALFSFGGFIGVFKIFTKNYYIYIFIEFMESFLSSGILPAAIVLLIEIGGESKRVTAGILYGLALDIGDLIFVLFAMGLQYWKYLIIAINAPMIVYISYFKIIQESPRWQMLQGRINDVKKNFNTVSKVNGLDISPEQINDLDENNLKAMFDLDTEEVKESFYNALCSRIILIRVIVTSVCYFTSGFIFGGLSVNTVYLPGNKYVNYLLKVLSAFPGEFLTYYCLDKFGRRISLLCGYMASAVFIIAQAYIPESISWLKILLFLLGNLCCVLCYTGIYMYSAELFPTSVRGTLAGSGNTVAMFGNMLAPLTPMLISTSEDLPAILFSLTALISGMLLLFLPETKSLPMCDTIAQVEVYNQKYKESLWSSQNNVESYKENNAS